MRSEEEVTKTLQLVVGLYQRLGHKLAEDPELSEMMKPLDADEIERQLRRKSIARTGRGEARRALLALRALKALEAKPHLDASRALLVHRRPKGGAVIGEWIDVRHQWLRVNQRGWR